jgi:hypothetical protein
MRVKFMGNSSKWVNCNERREDTPKSFREEKKNVEPTQLPSGVRAARLAVSRQAKPPALDGIARPLV